MRKLIENIVYKNFVYDPQGLVRLGINSPLSIYLGPLTDMNWEDRNKWITESRLKHIKKLMKLLSDEQLLDCLTEQHCEQFR